MKPLKNMFTKITVFSAFMITSACDDQFEPVGSLEAGENEVHLSNEIQGFPGEPGTTNLAVVPQRIDEVGLGEWNQRQDGREIINNIDTVRIAPVPIGYVDGVMHYQALYKFQLRPEDEQYIQDLYDDTALFFGFIELQDPTDFNSAPKKSQSDQAYIKNGGVFTRDTQALINAILIRNAETGDNRFNIYDDCSYCGGLPNAPTFSYDLIKIGPVVD